MDVELNNDKNNQKQNDIYTMINDLKNKYEILEKRQMINEELSLKNKDVNLNLNKNLKLLKDLVINLKNKFGQNINELKESIDKIKKENNIDIIKKLSLEQINDLQNKYNEMCKEIDKKIETLKNEIKININNINNNNNIKANNNIQIENNNNNINIKNNKNTELIINKEDEKTIFQKFENLIAIIIDKNNIDDKIKEELNQYCEKLIINNISPVEYTAKYFSGTYKYLENGIEKEKFDKLLKANEKLILAVEEIEKRLNKKRKQIKKDKKPNKKKDKKIEEYREKYSLLEEDASSDNLIRKYLKQYKNNEIKAYQAIMSVIVYAGEKNKIK